MAHITTMKEVITAICANFIKAHQSNQMDGFLPFLSEEAELIRFGRGTIAEHNVILNYLNNMSVYHRTQTVDYCIVDMPFWDMPVVKIHVHNEGILFVAFRVVNEHVTHIIFPPEPCDNYICFNSLECPPFDLQYIKDGMTEDVEPKEHHYPCMKCGLPSEKMRWHRFFTHEGSIHEYGGFLSVCPDCGRETEFYANMRLRMR